MPKRNRGRHLWRDPRTGLWHVRWFEAGRQRSRSTGSRDSRAAQETLARLELELARPQVSAEPMLAEVLDAYVAASTERYGYRQIKGKAANVKARLGWLRVAELRQAHVRTYIAARRKDGIRDGTIREELAKLRAAMRWGEREGLCTARPILIPLEASLRGRWLTRPECDRLLAAARAPHIRLLILLALHTAGRLGALLELPWASVDMDAGVIDLGHKPRGKPRAIVPMTATLRRALVDAREVATTRWVIEYAGQRLRQASTGWKAAVRRSGLVDVTRHDLRRTAGSLMLQDGITPERVAAFLGHKSTRTTLRVYARLAVEHLRDAAAVLDR